MTITREQVADLRRGDVVELTDATWNGAVVRGPVWSSPAGILYVGDYTVRAVNRTPYSTDTRTMTVISRAPRPFYVNSDREHPEQGDAVRDADNDDYARWWWFDEESDIFRRPWIGNNLSRYAQKELPARLRLLIDGTTGLPPEEAAR